MALINKLSAIGNAIREKTGKTDLLTLDQMPQEISSIETGGEDSYYDEFWDTYQQNGERTDYEYAFTGRGWNERNFYPKYDIKPIDTAYYMFSRFPIEIDLEQKLKECGVVLDTKNCKNLNRTFWYCEIETIPTIDCSSVKLLDRTFSYCKIKTIKKIIYNKDIVDTYAFWECFDLTNITIEGEIGKNLDLSYPKLLTIESVDSIINALIDLTGNTTQTLKLNADVKAKLTETQIASITSKNWTLA